MINTFVQSANSRCVAAQNVFGILLAATNTPESVREVLAHGGLTISDVTLSGLLDSVRRDCVDRLTNLGKTGLVAIAYDNLDFKMPAGETTMTRQNTFESITTGVIVPLMHGVTHEDLHCAKEIVDATKRCRDRGDTRSSKPGIPFNDVRLNGQSAMVVERAMAWQILWIIIHAHFPEYKDSLSRPETSFQIPATKNSPIPARAMRAKVSTNDGNVEAVQDLMQQAGIRKDDASEYVVIVNGDLGVLKRLEGVQNNRSIETNAYESLRHLVTVPGLFHVKMAAADAVWRTYIEPKALRNSDGSVYTYFSMLNSRDTSKLNTNTPFRMMHTGIETILKAAVLECWRLESGSATLEEFREQARPGFAKLTGMAHTILKKYVGADLDRMQSRGEGERDIVFENSVLFLRDALLYRVLSDLMNHGEIGTVEDVLWLWIPMFKSTHKHKYAAHLSKFLTHLRDVYPSRLSRAIRLHWLCNPRGKSDTFRAIDWYVEWNNLYHKVSSQNGSRSRLS